MSRPSLVLAGVFCLTIACQSEEKAPESSASAKASASATPAKAPTKVKSARAREHLPPGCDVAVEVDVQKLFENPLIGQQLLISVVPPKDPALRAQVMANPEQASFLKFLEASKIEPQRDLETIAFCMPEGKGDEESRYLAVIAGKFPGGLVEVFRDNAPSDKQYTLETLGKERALFREGKWLTQGAGNVVLFGNDKELILAAQKPSKAYEAYELASARDVAITLSREALASLEGPPGDPLMALIKRGKRVQLEANLAVGDLKGAVSLPDAAAVDQLDKGVKALREQLKLQSQQAPPAMRQVMQPTIDVLDKTEFTKRGTKLEFAVKLPPGMMEAALQQFAMSSFGAGAAPGAPGPMMAQMQPGQVGRPMAPPRRRPTKAVRTPGKGKAPPPPAALAPLPELPSFQLTPPSVLRDKSVATTPQLAPQKPLRAAGEPKESSTPNGG